MQNEASMDNKRKGKRDGIEWVGWLLIFQIVQSIQIAQNYIQHNYFRGEEMGKMIQNYSLQNELGRGMYSTVYKAINIKNQQEVAIKMVKAQKFKQYPKLEEGTYNEINILTNLESCPHIIKYYDMLKTINNFYFVYEFCNGGTLENLLKEKGMLPQKTALVYFAQIVAAFRILNKHNIMHRDLKPENLLLHDGIIKLADFGFCKPLQNQDEISRTMLGSPIYMAPEVLKGEPYSIKADIWSLGVVLFRMLFGYCPFQSNNIGKLIMIIEEEKDIVIPTNKAKVSPEICQLLKRMIVKNANQRAQWSEIFSYDIKNGEIIKSFGARSKTPTSTTTTLKRSFILSETTAPGLMASQRIELAIVDKIKHQVQKDLLHTPKNNNQLRNTYTGKTPFRQNFKKDLFIKNHQKTIDIFSLGTSLIVYQTTESFALSFLIVKNTQKQLVGIFQSAKKQYELKNDDQTLKGLLGTIEGELRDIRYLMGQLAQVLREQLQFPLEWLQKKKGDLLRVLLGSWKLQQFQELVIASRLVDYIIDELMIRRQTFQKMSRDKLLSNIRFKIKDL